jgi:hypothetical protein
MKLIEIQQDIKETNRALVDHMEKEEQLVKRILPIVEEHEFNTKKIIEEKEKRNAMIGKLRLYSIVLGITVTAWSLLNAFPNIVKFFN